MNRLEDLRQLLDTHRPSDAREAGFVERIRALTLYGEAAFNRENYAPGHITASAGGWGTSANACAGRETDIGAVVMRGDPSLGVDAGV